MAPFFALGRFLGASWAHLAHLAAFVVTLCPFLHVLGRSGFDFGRVWNVPGMVLEVQNKHFSKFFRTCKLAMRKTLAMQKPQFFLGFCRFLKHRKLFAWAEQQHQVTPGASRPSVPTPTVLKTRFGVAFGRIGAPLGVTWPALGTSWAACGPCWALLGRLLGASGALLAFSLLVCGAP